MAVESQEFPIVRVEHPDRLIIQLAPQTEVKVYIPSASRAECYAQEIARALFELNRQMPRSPPVTTPPSIMAGSTTSTSTILPIITPSYLQLNYQKILNSCANYLVGVFDQELLLYQDKDLESYRKEKSITSAQINTLSVAQAVDLYQRYQKERSEGHRTYTNYMRIKYPEFIQTLGLIGTNFYHNTVQALQRIQNDMTLLQKDLLKDLSPPVILSNIHITTSDLHKQGQHVIILKFKGNNTQARNVVYKPSSLLADAFLVGNMHRLGAICPEFLNCTSLLNIFNQHLSASKEHPELPTYLIIPRLDGNADQIKSHYGYLEYITHEPWQEMDYERVLQESLRSLPPRLRGNNQTTQLAINRHFTQSLQRAAQNADCDFIARTQEEIARYSRDCGILLSILVAVGGTDLHCQNMIINRLRPILIDAEICFSQTGLNPEVTACFNNMIGAIRNSSANYDTVRCLFDICGLEQKTLTHLEKNRMFRLFTVVGNQLIACQPDKKLFLEGFALGLKILTENHRLVQGWLNDIERLNITVRVIPFDTQHFKTELASIRDQKFSNEFFAVLRAQYIECGHEQHQLALREFQEISPRERDFQNIPSPDFAIYFNNDPNLNILSEYRALNIPFYYTRVNARTLFDSNNQPVRIPLHNLMPRHLSGNNPIDTTINFYQESAIDFIRNRVRAIAERADLRERMMQKVEEESDCLTRAEEVESALTTIILNDAPQRLEPESHSSPWPKQPSSTPLRRSEQTSTEDEPLLRREEGPDNKDKKDDGKDRGCCRLM